MKKNIFLTSILYLVLLLGVDRAQAQESMDQLVDEMIPVSRFGESKVLAPIESGYVRWNVGDLDGDGDLDLILPHAEEGFQVWKQNGDHVFEAFDGGRITDEGFPEEPVDVDGDGDLDLWISEKDFFVDASPSVLWLNNGDGTFVRSDVELPISQSVFFEDFDNDGDQDAVAVVPAGDHKGSVRFDVSIQLWINDGSGQFFLHSSMPIVCWSPYFPTVVGDWNDDGFVDVFYGCSGQNKVLLNQGDGTFKHTQKTYSSSNLLTIFVGSHLAQGDVDGDGDLDVVIPNKNIPSVIWLNEGSGDFELGNTNPGMEFNHAVLGDIDTDGDLDLVFQRGNNFGPKDAQDGMHIFWNEGPDQFLKGEHLEGGDQTNAPRLLDIDQDGDMDVVARQGNSLIVYHNSIEYVKPAGPGEGIQIPDDGLKRGIHEALGKKLADAITEEDMLELTSLDLSIETRGISAPPISDFTGLEWASNLVSLDLSGRDKHLPAIVDLDLSFLSSLKKLKTLKLPYNGLTQFEVPDTLEHLEILDVSNNILTEFRVPREWTQLKELRVGNNQIGQLHLTENMSRLERLSAPFNELSELHIPGGLKQLITLSLSDNKLQTITLPPDLLKLSVMYFSGNPIEELEIPEMVGSQSGFHFIATGASLRTFKAPISWQNGLIAQGAFIRADQLRMNKSGHLEFSVFASQGTIIIEKSLDLKKWTTIKRIPASASRRSRIFSDPDTLTQKEGFYRVRLVH